MFHLAIIMGRGGEEGALNKDYFLCEKCIDSTRSHVCMFFSICTSVLVCLDFSFYKINIWTSNAKIIPACFVHLNYCFLSELLLF